MKQSEKICKPCWRPQIGGLGLGLAIVLAYYLSGRGVGATGGVTRIVATVQHWLFPRLTEHSEYFAGYFAGDTHPLNSYLVYMLAGIISGSFFAALFNRHLRIETLRGPNVGVAVRLGYALCGGVLVGFAARLARGCTSGQALVGGGQLSVGAWAFMMCIFIGGFAAAWFVRRQWL